MSHRERGRAASRWIIALAALVAVAATARLGWWQLDRAAQKQGLQAALEERAMMPPLGNAELGAEPAARQHHRVARLRGRWLPEHTVYLDNRPMNGRAGFFVLTPLLLTDGTAVLVQRGWQPRDLRDRTRVQPVATPVQAEVQVRGRVAPPPSRLLEFEGLPEGALRQNVDLEGLSREWRLALRPISLVQLEPALLCTDEAADAPCLDEAADGLLRDWTVVASSPDKNRGYAVQWFSLSALVAALYLWFQVILPRRRARASN